MKTNQIMTRKMGEFNVYQRTSDAYFNASSLMQQWNETNHSKQKEVRKYFDLKQTKDFLEELSKKPNGEKGDTDNQLVIVIKGKKTKKGQTPDEYWMHPYVFLDYAMWINPRFRVEVIEFVYDQLITLRNQIGDEYREFSACCAKIGCVTPEDYKVMARCLNCAVLGRSRQSNQRNELTVEESEDLKRVYTMFIGAVDNSWINSIDEAKAFFKKEYEKRFGQPQALPWDGKESK